MPPLGQASRPTRRRDHDGQLRMSGGGADEGGRTWSRHYRRPYTVTGGRTRPAHDDLELETLVQTVTGISARLDLLLGVTRVIVGDLALQGVVLLHRPQGTVADADRPPVELLEKVLHGLKNIS
jgi:Protein of unknown function (DUF742)